MKSWMLAILGVSVLTTCALTITPEGRVRPVVRFVCALCMMTALMSPMLELDLAALRGGIWKYKNELMEREASAAESGRSINKLFIRRECESYIMEKGTSLGCRLQGAKVTMRWSEDGYWYPTGAELSASSGTGGDRKLTELIISELGIASDCIGWVYADEG